MQAPFIVRFSQNKGEWHVECAKCFAGWYFPIEESAENFMIFHGAKHQ